MEFETTRASSFITLFIAILAAIPFLAFAPGLYADESYFMLAFFLIMGIGLVIFGFLYWYSRYSLKSYELGEDAISIRGYRTNISIPYKDITKMVKPKDQPSHVRGKDLAAGWADVTRTRTDFSKGLRVYTTQKQLAFKLCYLLSPKDINGFVAEVEKRMPKKKEKE